MPQKDNNISPVSTPSNSGEIVLYQPDDKLSLEVKLENESVWLSQQQMAVLFDVKENNITYHIQSIYKAHELDAESTTQKIRVVRQEGVSADIYSSNEHTTLRNTHNAAAGVEPVNTHQWSKPSHDRWLIIDDNLFHCGHSIKDMGKKLSAIMLMGTSPETVLNAVK